MNDSSIVIGQKFGMYTVVGPAAPDEKDRHRKWICRCDCGTERAVLETNLKRGHSTSCGCKKRASLEGQRRGKLTVLERSDRYGSRGKRKTRLWKCQCDCGAITYKATDTLNNPDISMCKRCAEEYTAAKAREGAGYVGGTQLCKIVRESSASENISGVRGIYFDAKTQMYRVRVRFQGKMHEFGRYHTLEEAVKVRQVAEDDIFGEFLRKLEETE